MGGGAQARSCAGHLGSLGWTCQGSLIWNPFAAGYVRHLSQVSASDFTWEGVSLLKQT